MRENDAVRVDIRPDQLFNPFVATGLVILYAAAFQMGFLGFASGLPYISFLGANDWLLAFVAVVLFFSFGYIPLMIVTAIFYKAMSNANHSLWRIRTRWKVL